jgi:hypothetical protein
MTAEGARSDQHADGGHRFITLALLSATVGVALCLLLYATLDGNSLRAGIEAGGLRFWSTRLRSSLKLTTSEPALREGFCCRKGWNYYSSPYK